MTVSNKPALWRRALVWLLRKVLPENVDKWFQK